uniref:HYR domain-containing protein n=1 Tax=Bizionia psychrotolerans TaxID=1492901 RepID=UPI0006524882
MARLLIISKLTDIMKKITFYSLLLFVVTFSTQSFSKTYSSDFYSAFINQAKFANPISDFVSLRPGFAEASNLGSDNRGITSCPTSFSVTVDSGTCGAVVNFTLPTTDISGGSMTLFSALGNGDIFPSGLTTVIYEERDNLNATTGLTCSFTITVVDNEVPIPSTASLADVTDQCSVTSLTPPTATDNCGGLVTVTNDATL